MHIYASNASLIEYFSAWLATPGPSQANNLEASSLQVGGIGRAPPLADRCMAIHPPRARRREPHRRWRPSQAPAGSGSIATISGPVRRRDPKSAVVAANRMRRCIGRTSAKRLGIDKPSPARHHQGVQAGGRMLAAHLAQAVGIHGQASVPMKWLACNSDLPCQQYATSGPPLQAL